MKLNIARVGLIAMTLLVATSAVAVAQNSTFSMALSGGMAGSFDEDTGRLICADVGQDATIDYLTIAGEYLFAEGNYESGFFMGLGLYDLTAVGNNGEAGDEGTVGLVFGAVGEFDVAERWFVYGEAAFHYINLDAAQMFADIQIGLGFRF